MTHPIANARLRPIIAPTFAPVIISAAITSVYAVIAPWIPLTVVPTSFATVAIETFITELSSVIKNWPAARVIKTSVAPWARADRAISADVTGAILPEPQAVPHGAKPHPGGSVPSRRGPPEADRASHDALPPRARVRSQRGQRDRRRYGNCRRCEWDRYPVARPSGVPEHLA